MSESRKKKAAAASPITLDGPNITLDAKSLELVESVTYNVKQDLIVVTRDKVEICLTKHVKAMEQRQLWLAPFGVFLASLATLITSTFRDTLGMTAAEWRAVFLVVTILSAAATAWLVWRAWRAKSVHDVIDEIRAQGLKQATPIETRP